MGIFSIHMNEADKLKSEIRALQMQKAKLEEQIAVALDRTRHALFDIQNATAKLRASENNLAGNPEPKIG